MYYKLLHNCYFCFLFAVIHAFSDLTLLVGSRKAIRPVKELSGGPVGCWHGYLSGLRCRFAYGPADATATYSLLLQYSPHWFWYRLTQVIPDKVQRAIKWMCVCVCSICCYSYTVWVAIICCMFSLC